MHQSDAFATFGKDILDAGFFAKGAFSAYKLDLKAVLLREVLSVPAQLDTERLGVPRIIEETNAQGTQVGGHAIAVADARQGAAYDDAVKT